jgi:hypothetical protein
MRTRAQVTEHEELCVAFYRGKGSAGRNEYP